MHMNRFCFIDSSGIIKNDKFFGTGLLIVKNVGDMIDKLAKNAQPAYSDAKKAKDKVIDKLISMGEYDQVIKILKMLIGNNQYIHRVLGPTPKRKKGRRHL